MHRPRPTLWAALCGGLGLLVVAGLVALQLGSQWRLHQRLAVPSTLTVPLRGDAVEGARRASVLGCRACHGADLGGRAPCYEEPGRLSLSCPNVTEARERYSDADLVALIRHGRKRDGAWVDFMPWDMCAGLSDADLGHVLASVRALPAVAAPPQPASTYAWSVRWAMLNDRFPEVNAPEQCDVGPRSGAAERGRYLARVACTGCHGPDLRGYPGSKAPDLVVAKAYAADTFARLMSEGITLAGGESTTGFMSKVARQRFAHLRPDEVSALKAFLDGLAP